MVYVKLGWRSLLRNRRRTLITVTAIGLGFAYALFFISLLAGVQKKAIDDATRMLAGHVIIEHPEYRGAPSILLRVHGVQELASKAEAVQEVERVKVLVAGEAMVATAAGAAAVSFLGVDPGVERESSPLAKALTAGRYLEKGDVNGLVVGVALADQLGLAPGKKVILTTTDVEGQTTEEAMRVTGIFKMGSEELDAGFVQMPLASARRILHMPEDEASQVGLVLREPSAQGKVVEEMRAAVAGKGVAVLRWQDELAELASWELMTKSVNTVMAGIILFLVMFTILNTLLMSVFERSREFAVLLALGTPPGLMRAQILAECIILALAGVGGGLALGGTVSLWAQHHGLDFRGLFEHGTTVGSFALDMYVHPEPSWNQVVGLVVLVFTLTILFAIYPMLRAARTNMATTLRSR